MSEKVLQLFPNQQSHSLQEQLAILAKVSQSFASSLDIKETLKSAIDLFVDYMDAEAASIFLLEDCGTEVRCHECVGPANITGLTLKVGQGIVGKSIAEHSVQLVRDTETDPDFDVTIDKNTGFCTRSILCAPLLVEDECLGALEIINKKDGGLFDVGDQHLLTALASSAALAIKNARIAGKLVEQHRISHELNLAREIQEKLLPNAAKELPITGINIPAYEVSGDFFDYFQREDGLIYFNLADVSGKGMNAAMLMAQASSLLHQLAKSVTDPVELISRVNNEICESVTHGMFITIVSGFFDVDKNKVSFVNAGHQPLLMHTNDNDFISFPATGIPIGIISGYEYEETVCDLDEGSLYIFTDGVTESRIDENTYLGETGLKTILKNYKNRDMHTRLHNIVADVQRSGFVQQDDITLLIIDSKNAE